jgi:hypothetical protein
MNMSPTMNRFSLYEQDDEGWRFVSFLVLAITYMPWAVMSRGEIEV